MKILLKLPYWFLFVLFFLISCTVLAQVPGTVKVDRYLVDQAEVSNQAWLEYIYYVEKDSGLVYAEKMYPNEVNTTWRDPDKRNCPITFISYKQALAYCQWRSAVVSEKFSAQRVVYRLPSPNEWEEITRKYYQNNQGVYSKEFTTSIRQLKKWDKRKKKIPCNCETANENQLSNLLGNVSEMTTKQGIAIGLNFGDLSKVNESFVPVINYEQSSTYIGFRCIAEIVAK